ncbi:hypothetical protein GLOIN_2v759589 [Rhizophagus clarus]|uniref:Uncharacterized protein n=1 Tax=Rhizophagus clarus TaxID=94130 RepID=A0A8H3KTT6_9GLOM|nr:hypothetical protein GLOIN_2v759589 [Rhizophagus clarus]
MLMKLNIKKYNLKREVQIASDIICKCKEYRQKDNVFNYIDEKEKKWICSDYCECTMSIDSIKKADKRAFIMKDCDFTEIKTGGYVRGKLEFESKEDWMKKQLEFLKNRGTELNKAFNS